MELNVARTERLFASQDGIFSRGVVGMHRVASIVQAQTFRFWNSNYVCVESDFRKQRYIVLLWMNLYWQWPCVRPIVFKLNVVGWTVLKEKKCGGVLFINMQFFTLYSVNERWRHVQHPEHGVSLLLCHRTRQVNCFESLHTPARPLTAAVPMNPDDADASVCTGYRCCSQHVLWPWLLTRCAAAIAVRVLYRVHPLVTRVRFCLVICMIFLFSVFVFREEGGKEGSRSYLG